MTVAHGQTAPDFEQDTINGSIRLHGWIGGSWCVPQVSPHFLLRVKLYLAAYTWRVGLRCSSRQSATCVYITPRPAPCHYVYFCFSQAKLMH